MCHLYMGCIRPKSFSSGVWNLRMIVARCLDSRGRRRGPLPVALEFAVLPVKFVAFLQHHTQSDDSKQVFHSRVPLGFFAHFPRWSENLCRDIQASLVEDEKFIEAGSENFMTARLSALKRRVAALGATHTCVLAERCQMAMRQDSFLPRAASTDEGERTRRDWHSVILLVTNSARLPSGCVKVCRLD